MAAPTPGAIQKIYRGGAWDNNPEQRELPAAAAGILPGNVLFRTATTFKKTDTNGQADAQVFVAKAPMHQAISYSYASGETVFAYIPRRKEVYACRVAATQTIAASAPVTVDAAGRVRAALTDGTETVIGYAVSAIASPAVDTLVDIQFV